MPKQYINSVGVKRSGGKVGAKRRTKQTMGVKPKRARNAYSFFYVKNYDRRRSATENAKALGQKWRRLSASEKAPFIAKAKADLKRSQRERATLKANRAGNRQPSEYIQWATSRRAQIQRDHPDLSFGEISKILGEEWRNGNHAGRYEKNHHGWDRKDLANKFDSDDDDDDDDVDDDDDDDDDVDDFDVEEEDSFIEEY